MKPLYFVSDLHLGSRGDDERRGRFFRFLDRLRPGAGGLYILGDLFEFGFEYEAGIPRRDVPTAERISRLAQSGVPVVLVKGNHDCWLGARFQERFGIAVHESPLDVTVEGRRLFLAHGDDVDRSKVTRWTSALFRSRLTTGLYRILPERLGVRLASKMARASRNQGGRPDLVRALEDLAARQVAAGFDFVVLAHVHQPALQLVGSGWYLNTGDWIRYYSYGVLDDAGMRLERFEVEPPPQT